MALTPHLPKSIELSEIFDNPNNSIFVNTQIDRAIRISDNPMNSTMSKVDIGLSKFLTTLAISIPHGFKLIGLSKFLTTLRQLDILEFSSR